MPNLLLFNKPFNVLCQFTDEPEYKNQRETLADYINQPGFYAAGRLDRDSEGLLLLTNDGKLQQQIANPKTKQPKTYLVQVEGEINQDAIKQLQQGVKLKDGLTRPAKARKVAEPKWLWERNPPVRERKNIPTTWIELSITEGKNRQVRRMTAAVGFPTLRLVRTQIGKWKLGNLALGEFSLLENQAI
ncbi:MAG: rRNA large subunit pseudouridine synthase E [Pseudomonadota bacterium]|nr:rRNA large subunit pseudouridine synthase E [Pseudomonadota bacterium]